MNTEFKKIQVQEAPHEKLSPFYLGMNIALLCVLPTLCIITETITEETPLHWTLIGKWFIFWAAGVRLFTAGIKQASNPEFTAHEIFKLKNTESLIVIRELGFANISLGVMGILSLINEHWRLLGAIASSIFFGLAALQHFSRKPDSINEYVALVYDSVVFIVLTLFSVFTFPLLS
ncbi:MAG: hypothetical protein QM802_18305 [Agriterribacter sp.]